MRYNWFDMLPERAFRKAPLKGLSSLEGGGPSAPAAPDPYATASATTQSNQQTAAYNKALNQNNYSNPFGSQQSQIVGKDPQTGAPIYQTNITANPQLQQALTDLLGRTGDSNDYMTGALRGVRGLPEQLSGLNSGLSNLQGSLDPAAAQQFAKNGQDAYYKSATAYLDPQYAQQQESLESKLANQGITPGSEAYNNAMGNFNRDKAFAYNQAANSAITSGTDLGLKQLQGQESVLDTKKGLFNAISQNIGAQGGLYGQQAGLSQIPYQNLQTIAQMIPGYSGPAQSQAGAADIAKYMQNAYQGKLNVYNADTASNNQQNSEYAQLGAMAAMYMFSDRRLKKNIEEVGTLRNGVPIYSYQYVWDADESTERLGAMADEVKQIIPDAVSSHPSGFDMVDYSKVIYG